MTQVSADLNGPYPRGVINPYTAHVHPYPTRFHGAIYTRPVFGMPYVRNPHAVFKPDDFYEYYGVKGLGSFHSGSSIGNGLVGGNTLGLGATGTPIYYLASRSNPKVVTLQGGLNKVLVAQGYREIPVTGKLDALTCAALGLMAGKFKANLRSQVNDEILQEAAATCNLARRNSVVQNQINAAVRDLEANRNPTPAKTLTPQTEVVPADSKPDVISPPPSIQTPSIPPVVKVKIEDPPPLPTPVTIPEMEVSARPPDQGFGKMGIALGLLAVAGAGYYFYTKRG